MLTMTLTTNPSEPKRGDVVLEANERPFKSGAKGYFLGGKVAIDGKLYQLSANVIEIGSKDDDGAAERRAQAEAIEAAKLSKRAAVAAVQQ